MVAAGLMVYPFVPVFFVASIAWTHCYERKAMNLGAHILCVPRFTNRTARARVDMTALILYSLATTAAPAVLSRLATRDATRLHVVPVPFHSPSTCRVGRFMSYDLERGKMYPLPPCLPNSVLKDGVRHTLTCADCKCVPPRLNLSGGGRLNGVERKRCARDVCTTIAALRFDSIRPQPTRGLVCRKVIWKF